MSNVPVLQAVKAAWAFQRLHWRSVAGVLGTMAVVEAVGTSLASLAPQPPAWAPFLTLASIVVIIPAYMALMRLALQDEHPGDPDFQIGPHGFQWGKPETRFLAIAALMGFLFFLAAVTLVFVAMVVVAGSALGNLADAETPQAFWESLGPRGQAIMTALSFAFLAGIAVFSVRLSLAPAATVARKKVLLFETWKLTKGQFFRIFAATVLTVFPPVAVSGLLAGVVGRLTGAPDAIGETAPFVATFPPALISALVSAFVVLPLSTGLTAFLYRGLREEPDVVTETFA